VIGDFSLAVTIGSEETISTAEAAGRGGRSSNARWRTDSAGLGSSHPEATTPTKRDAAIAEARELNSVYLVAMYNPPPGGGGPPGWGPPQPAHDPYAAYLAAWAQERKHELLPTPDVYFVQSWFPFQYIPRLERITKHLKTKIGDADLHAFEVFEADQVKQMTGDHRQVLFLLMSPLLKYRVALQSKTSGNVGDDLSRGLKELGSFFGGPPKPPVGGILGDPTLESRFDVMAPSPQEGHAALPVPLRQILVAPNFRGILELRQQGMATILYTHRSFDPQTLEHAMQVVGSMYQAASAAP
jgi:hypothetical protein